MARADEASVANLLASHLGPGADTVSVVSASWPRYDHVNVQAGLDEWLSADSREHRVAGLTGFRFHPRMAGLSDLLRPGPFTRGIAVGSVTTTALPAGPGGLTRPCVQGAVYLVTEEDGPMALLMRGPDDDGPADRVVVEVAAQEPARAQRAVDGIRRLALERNVYRGHIIEFGAALFGRGDRALLSFVDRPEVIRDQVILPSDVLEGIERQVLGIARHSARLSASGQHLKRGVLLHGPPGTGKTHTIRYLLSRLTDVTVVLLSGPALRLIGDACSVARALAPALIVVEDVDLIAEHREMGAGQHPLLFELLNEMDGLGEDLNVTFLLTTNRPDLLEPALAARPGRVDHAALLPMPDADARERLLRLYQGSLVLDLSEPGRVISRTEGVTASFMKELLRRAALQAAEDAEARADDTVAPLRVTDEHLNAALDQLMDSRQDLTRVLLGGRAGGRDVAAGRPAGAEPGARGRPRPGGPAMGADAVVRDPARGRRPNRPPPAP